jgi:hypothetical protein
MTKPPAASELLTVPVTTDGDVLNRVSAIISPAARRHRALWLFLLQEGGIQANLIVPIDEVPERPDAALVANVCRVASESIAQTASLASVIITFSRPGTPLPTTADLRLLRALRQGAAKHATPVRLLCLATPEGVSELGPANPAR